MKNKIALRLTSYFAIALLLFAIIIGSVFTWTFSQYATNLHKEELSQRATAIAATIGEFIDNGVNISSNEPGGGHNGGYGAYLRYLDDIAMADVWLIDIQSNQITRNHGNSPLNYKELPADAEEVITEIFSNTVAFSESFSEFLGEKTLTVGAPIIASAGTVQGAVLLHSSVDGLSKTLGSQYLILAISILIALALITPMTILFSTSFTKPLNHMKNTSGKLASGDYQVKNNISQNDEIGELANSIDILADRLADTDRERKEMEKMRQVFFSNISHELRTPVTVIRGSLEALYDGVVSDQIKIKEYHKQMLNESIHMQLLINDLLELSRLQSTDFQIEMSSLNLRDIVDDVSRSMQYLADKKNISIQVENLPKNIPFYGDYNRLRQMIIIVVDNAIKFSPKDSTVKIEYSEKKCCFILSVTDCGPGIAEENLPFIFDRFHKKSTELNQQGSGLGLAIAKEIAQRHKLEIDVSSRPNHTEFLFRFPSDNI